MLTLDFPSRGRRFRAILDTDGEPAVVFYDRTNVTDPDDDGTLVNQFHPDVVLAHQLGRPLVLDSYDPVRTTLSGLAAAYLLGWIVGLRAKATV